MRFVHFDDNGVLALNYMWLPTWIGLNATLKRDMEKTLSERFVGRTSEELDAMHEEVIEYLATRFPLAGLRDYLDGVKYVDG